MRLAEGSEINVKDKMSCIAKAIMGPDDSITASGKDEQEVEVLNGRGCQE